MLAIWRGFNQDGAVLVWASHLLLQCQDSAWLRNYGAAEGIRSPPGNTAHGTLVGVN